MLPLNGPHLVSRLLFQLCIAVTAVTQALAVPGPGTPSPRIALVIGNASYSASPLKTPVHDARAVAATLRRLGFEVEEKINLSHSQMNESIVAFGTKLQAGGVAFFYYAGYGLQVSGANYLIPVDAEVENGNVVSYKSVDVAQVLAQLHQARSAFNIMVLDACRTTPYTRTFRATGDGLARLDAPANTLLAYATSPDSTASDGSGSTSMYTEELVKTLETPDLTVEESFELVRNAVHYRTAYVQLPWESSALVKDCYLFPSSQPSGTPPAGSKAVPVESPPNSSTALKTALVTTAAELPSAVSTPEPLLSVPGSLPVTVNTEPPTSVPASAPATRTQPVVVKSAPVASTPSPLPTIVNAEPVAPVSPLSAATSSPQPALSALGTPPTTHNAEPATLMPARLQESDPPPSLEVFPRVPGSGLELVPVTGGCFTMGDVFGENRPGRVYGSDEYPLHEACVSAFAIGSHEVTQGLWRRVMGANTAAHAACGDCPVENVSWNDVQAFIRQLNSETGQNYRLPTEAEWEYACRSGGKKERYCGGGNEDAVAWYASNSGKKTHPVGEKKPNGLGIFDMSGNVAEWCQDWYAEYPAGSVSDYSGPAAGTRRVFRGGSWNFSASSTRASIRSPLSPDLRGNFLGFRLAAPGQNAKAERKAKENVPAGENRSIPK